MDTIHHGINLNVHNVLDVNMHRLDNGHVRVVVRHKVHNCSDNTYGVAEFEMTLFAAEGGILIAPIQEQKRRAA